jgi:hypothetical protein
MHGYGEFIWPEGKKYAGFYKNDKKDGLGMYYWPPNRFFVGFWKDGKQNGVGKYIKGEVIKFGIWEEGKKDKWFINEDEFANCLDPRDERFSSIFQWGKTQLKKFMEITDGDNRNDTYNDYKSYRSYKSFKSIRSLKSIRSNRSRQTMKDDDEEEEEEY